MTKQNNALRLAGLLELAPEDGVEPQTTEDAAAELRRLHADNEALASKLKAYEDLDEAASDVQLLRMGYAAARLEIESLRARSVVPAAALAQLRHIYANLKNGGVRDTAQAKRIADSLLGPVIESMERAQAAPAYKDCTPELHVGDSAFESWYSNYNPAHKADKQRARDAYAAGMGDPLVTAAPAAVAGCTRSHPHENMDSACQAKAAIAEMQNMAARGAEATTSDLERFVAMLAAAPTTQPAPQQETQSALFDKQGFRAWVLHNLPDDTIIGSSAYWADHLSAWAQRFVKKAPQQEAQEPVAWYVTGCGRLLDEYDAEAEARRIGGTAKAMPLYTVPQPSPASQGDALDAVRLDWLDEDDGNHVSKVGKTWYTRPAYGRPYRKHKNLRAAIDAARKQGGAT